MSKLHDAIDRAEEMGKISAQTVADGLEEFSSNPSTVTDQTPGFGGLAKLVLDIYRSAPKGGEGEATPGDWVHNVCGGYQAGYNGIASRVPIRRIYRSTINDGVIAALPDAATDERAGIAEGLQR